MKQPDVQAELVNFEQWSGFIGNPPKPYLAVQMTVESPAGRQQLPWLALSPELARRWIEVLQTSLDGPTQSPPGSTTH